MSVVHTRAGQQSQQQDLINVAQLTAYYYALEPIADVREQQVQFGTSGHRGSAFKASFNQAHIVSISQAIVDVRRQLAITGPCFVGKDTHALSEPAFISVLEVLLANQVEVIIQTGDGFTPTPAISHAILRYNRQHAGQGLADGIVITPSHNPPEDGGIKYNPADGGPADNQITQLIEQRANQLLASWQTIKRCSVQQFSGHSHLHPRDLLADYVNTLPEAIDMQAIADSGLVLGVDPLGGAGLQYWQRIAEQYRLNLTLVNNTIDQTFRFMPLDYDGAIRMDCSSAFSMQGLLSLRDKFDLAFANDPDYDRHGIVTPTGLMNPNHYLSAAIDYLLTHRPAWSQQLAVGKTLVSSLMIDKVVAHLQRQLYEVPVGFKWFVAGLFKGQLAFAGEESAGATFLQHDGQPWTTDKDGLLLALLAAEMTAKLGKTPAQHYQQLTQLFGESSYHRLQAPATSQQKQILSQLSPASIDCQQLAGEQIIAKQTQASGNGAAIGGIKVSTEHGWFAARPSGTEENYKIYCESLLGEEHCQQIAQQAIGLIDEIFVKADVR